MADDQIGDAGELALGVVDHDRIAAEIGAGRDQHQIDRRALPVAAFRRRRRRRETADDAAAYRAASRRHATSPGATDGASAPRPCSSTIGRSTELSSARSAALASTMRVERGFRGDHHRERLGVAPLAPAQLGDRGLVARVAQQMIAAEALQRDDAAGAQPRHDLGDRMTEPAARRPGRRSARRGSGGRADRDSRGGNRRTSRSRPSRCWRDHRAGDASACSAARNGCS